MTFQIPELVRALDQIMAGRSTLSYGEITRCARLDSNPRPAAPEAAPSGAILGIGLHRKDVRWRVVKDIALAWVVTLPVARVIAALAHLPLSPLAEPLPTPHVAFIGTGT